MSFVESHVAKVRPLAKEAHLAYWQAAVTGDEAAYQKVGRLELQLRQIYSSPEDYAQLKALRASDQILDPVLQRQLDVLINAYLENQVEPELLKQIVELGTGLEQQFSTFRGTIDDKQVTANEIRDILKEQVNEAQRRKAWEASKQVGQDRPGGDASDKTGDACGGEHRDTNVADAR